MGKARLGALLSIALGSLLVLGAGCSAADTSGHQYGAATPGCSDGDCSACATCVDSCTCVTHGDPKCQSVCSGAAGAGGSGGGNEAWPGGAGAGGSASGSGGSASGSGGSAGGAGGSAAAGGAAGAAAGGSGGSGGSTTSGVDALHAAAMARAKAGVGFSYWWGHGRFLSQGPSSSNAGSCSGSCPSCTHSGNYGGDCSGFAAKVWQVPSSNNDLSVDSHPYSTLSFSQDTTQWSTVPRSSLQVADAMVYRQNGAGHIFIYDHGDGWGSMYAYECKGCSYGCTADMRTASSAYHAIRRTGY